MQVKIVEFCRYTCAVVINCFAHCYW